MYQAKNYLKNSFGRTRGVFLIQSFITVDPYTVNRFDQINRRNSLTNLVSIVQDNGYSDSAFYNREYSYYIGLVERTLEETNYEGDMIIVFPRFKNTPVGYGYTECFWWNTAKKRLQANTTTETVPVRIASREDELEESVKILYIVPFFTKESTFQKALDIEKQGQIHYRNMDLTYYVGSMAEKL